MIELNTAALMAQRQLDAYNNRDIEAFVECYSENVEFMRLQSGEVFCQGRDAVRSSYGKMFEEHPLLHCTLVNRIVCGNICIDEEQVAGLVPDQLVHAVATYEIVDGLIARAWFVRA